MATKKEIRGVIVPRHDTAINWSKAVNFTPENGELIIISADNATDVARGYYLDSEGNKLTSITVNSNGVNKVCTIKPSDKVRFKFGNGKDNVNALPFQTDALSNLVDGSSVGSIRSIGSKKEDSSYKIGRYAMAEGLGTQSGAKAFTILGVDETNKTYTLDSTEGLAIGDVYSAHVLYTIGRSTQAENYGKITAINGNVVTVDNLFCLLDFATADSYTDDGFDNEKNTFRIISKPNVGTRFIADVVHSEGISTKALSKGSHAEGEGTTAYGSWSHAEGNNTKAGCGAHAEGSGTTASGFISHAEGEGTTASGDKSHAEGSGTTASGNDSHAEGHNTNSSGYCSHAEGWGTKASGSDSHAEGSDTTASGDRSHAEGSDTTASGECSHAEGWVTEASGRYSHAEGFRTTASGRNSHAEGESTRASGENTHAQGRYNISNTNYADVIGNGDSDTERSNAYTMDWNGNAWFAGDIYIRSTSGKNKDEGSKKLATEEYIDKKIEVSDTAPIEEENKIWLKPITDSSEYIIEEGTNDIWTYRIWSSGISECWGKKAISVTTSTSNNGYYTGKVGSLQYPSNLFISEPILNCTLKASGFPGHLFIDGTESSSYTGTISIAAHSNTTVNGYIHLSAKGRWK